MARSIALPLVASLLLLSACSGPQPAPGDGAPTSASAQTAASAVAPVTASASAPAVASAAPDPIPSAAPSASAAAPIASAPPADAPLPKVKVENIGMHIGGGPNDAETKAPIHQSVSPHFDEFRRCFSLAEDPKKGGSFGVDLMIEKDGGKATVTKPRTSLEGQPFKDCVVGVFAGIDFLKPKKGKTKVSYSLRFTP